METKLPFEPQHLYFCYEKMPAEEKSPVGSRKLFAQFNKCVLETRCFDLFQIVLRILLR